jgi:hypothetical protein
MPFLLLNNVKKNGLKSNKQRYKYLNVCDKRFSGGSRLNPDE